jgi:hypothetical protein
MERFERIKEHLCGDCASPKRGNPAVKTFGSVLVNQILQFGRFCARSRYGVPFSLYQ